MHQLLHIGILLSTVLGAGGLALVLLWPLLSESPLPSSTRWALLVLIAVGTLLFLLEWRVVH